jgi:heat shock protein HslJ
MRKLTLACAGLALAFGACSGSTEPEVGPTPSESSPSVGTSPATVTDGTDLLANLRGRWVPLGEYLPKSAQNSPLSKGLIQFGTGRRWSGSDGCNSLRGTIDFDTDGLAAMSQRPSKLIGCANFSAFNALNRRVVSVDEDGSTFEAQDASGNVTVVYRRVKPAR